MLRRPLVNSVSVSSQMVEVNLNVESTEMMKAIPVFIAVLDTFAGFARHQTHSCVLVPRMSHTLNCIKSYEL